MDSELGWQEGGSAVRVTLFIGARVEWRHRQRSLAMVVSVSGGVFEGKRELDGAEVETEGEWAANLGE